MLPENELGFWITKEGLIIPIDELEDRHLLNIIKMMIRQAQKRQRRTVQFLLCNCPQGEMAEMDWDRALENLEESDWTEFLSEKFDEMIYEADKRKLNWEEKCTHQN